MTYFSLTTLLSSMHYSWLVYAPFFHWCCVSRDHPGILFTSFRMGSDCGAAVRVPGCGSAGHGFNPNSRHSVSHTSFRMVSKWVTWMSHWPLVGLMSSPLPQTQRVNEMEMSTVAKRSHSVCFQLYLYLSPLAPFGFNTSIKEQPWSCSIIVTTYVCFFRIKWCLSQGSDDAAAPPATTYT